MEDLSLLKEGADSKLGRQKTYVYVNVKFFPGSGRSVRAFRKFVDTSERAAPVPPVFRENQRDRHLVGGSASTPSGGQRPCTSGSGRMKASIRENDSHLGKPREHVRLPRLKPP
ncbi:hypothetical protein GCM10009116_05540 [Brevundimonas basaltis]